MSNEILTSAGGLGPERRSFDRIYVTGREPIESAVICETMGRIVRAVDRRQRLTRGVFRVVTNRDTISELVEQGLIPEATIPLNDYDRADSYLAIYGYNSDERARTIVPFEEMVEQTSAEEIPSQQMPNISEILAANNLSMTSLAGPAYHRGLFELWGETFGWTEEQIEFFCRDILLQSYIDPSKRNKWFSCIGQKTASGYPLPISSAAMAERLDIQGFNKTIHLVESTEWRTRQVVDGQPKGLIVPVLHSLNQQVLADLPDALIIAECNFASRSDRRGHQAGFVIPSREFSSQIHSQNVGVHDGKGDWPLRDFIVLNLSRHAIQNWYQDGGRA